MEQNEQTGAQSDSSQQSNLGNQEAMEERIVNAMFGPGEEAETDDAAAIAADTGDNQTEQQDAPADGEQPEGAVAAEANAAAADELVEVEFSGKQYKVPKEIKDSLMAQSDYTRKTQEVAEQRRMVEHRIQTQQQEAEFNKSVAPELEQLRQMDWQLAAYKGLDWAAMDTETMTRNKVAMDQLKDTRAEAVQTLQGKKAGFDRARDQTMREASNKTNEYLRKHIPQWGPDQARELVNYGLAEGWSDVELNSLNDARQIKALWKAHQWDKLQSQKGKPQAKAANAPPVVKPGASKPNGKPNDTQAYRTALSKAKTPGQRDAIIQEKLASRWFGGG